MKIGPLEINWGKPAAVAEEPSKFVEVEEQAQAPMAVEESPVMSVDEMEAAAYEGQFAFSPYDISVFDGAKFPGGFGITQLQFIDYWTLRARSSQLFNQNLYGRGLVRRLVTNEINIGLSLEATPDEGILGLEEDSLVDWSETVENRFHLWGKNPAICDWREQQTYGALQRVARLEALIGGDVLVISRIDRRTGLPKVQLISGNKVQSPWSTDYPINANNTVEYGVEKDSEGRIVAFWIMQDEGGFRRVLANAPRSGRKQAWLVYGTDKRHDNIRGVPLLGIVLQSLQELDKYRDAALRKAVINAMLAMFITKTEDKPGTLPNTGGAVRKNTVTTTDNDGKQRKFTMADQFPGMVIDELQTGEEPKAFQDSGTNDSYDKFEAAVINAIAWANEVPPEILTLAFSNNYSASQAAINEFKTYLRKVWVEWGDAFCTPIYVNWLMSEVLQGKVDAPGFFESWGDPRQYDTYGAWTSCEWHGAVKPSTDMVKQAKAMESLVANGWITNARAARELNGSKYTKNIAKLRNENALKAAANAPLVPEEESDNETTEDE